VVDRLTAWLSPESAPFAVPLCCCYLVKATCSIVAAYPAPARPRFNLLALAGPPLSTRHSTQHHSTYHAGPGARSAACRWLTGLSRLSPRPRYLSPVSFRVAGRATARYAASPPGEATHSGIPPPLLSNARRVPFPWAPPAPAGLTIPARADERRRRRSRKPYVTARAAPLSPPSDAVLRRLYKDGRDSPWHVGTPEPTSARQRRGVALHPLKSPGGAASVRRRIYNTAVACGPPGRHQSPPTARIPYASDDSGALTTNPPGWLLPTPRVLAARASRWEPPTALPWL